jgi:membrane protein DedA with SNARE-associated domain
MPEFSDQESPRSLAARLRHLALMALAIAAVVGALVLYARGWRFSPFDSQWR